jgi:3-dehydroquinate dehydratase-1
LGSARGIEVRGGPIGQGRTPLLCVPLVGRTRGTLLEELRALSGQQPDLIEWRADYYAGLADAAGTLAFAQELHAAAAGMPLIFTIRSQREGGEASAIDDGQAAALGVAVCRAQAAELIDVEMSAERPRLQRLRAAALESGTRLILSYHDFSGTPDADTLYAKFALAEALGAAVAKVAVMPNTPGDVLTLLGATLRAHQALRLPLISIAMGAQGAVTRLFGWQFGSAVSFAAGHAASAPGQLAIDDLRTLLRIAQREG